MKTKKKFQIFVLCLLMMIGIISYADFMVQANDDVAVEYTVGAVIPPTQINKQVSYFDVAVLPREKQKLITTITNNSNHSIYVRQQINNAYTNNLGQLSYIYPNNSAPKLDQSMRYPLTKILVLNNSKIVKIAAHGTLNVSATLNPTVRNNFNGTILGGWYFEQVDAKGKIINTTKTSLGMSYSYVIGIKLNFGHEVKPKLNFGMLAYHKNTNTFPNNDNLTVRIRNTAPVILHRAQLAAKVTGSNGKIQFTQKYPSISIAPNSGLTYDLTTKKKLIAGKYKLELIMTRGDQKWVEVRYFKLIKSKTNKLMLKETSKPINKWLLTCGVLGGLCLIGGVVWYGYRKRN